MYICLFSYLYLDTWLVYVHKKGLRSLPQTAPGKMHCGHGQNPAESVVCLFVLHISRLKLGHSRSMRVCIFQECSRAAPLFGYTSSFHFRKSSCWTTSTEKHASHPNNKQQTTNNTYHHNDHYYHSHPGGDRCNLRISQRWLKTHIW